MQTFVNSYNPLTPIGAAMQNVSLAMFGGKSPIQQEAEEAKIAALIAQHTERTAQARRHDAERALTESITGRRTDDSIDQDVSFRSGVQLPRVRLIKSHLMDGADLPPDITPAEVQRIGQMYFSHRGGMADRTYNPEGVERGIRLGSETTAWQAALADPTLVRPFARAQNARQGQGEFRAGSNGMVLNEFNGATDTNNPMALSFIGLNRGRTNQANAAAGASSAAGRASDALTRQRDWEIQNGVRLGPPVLIEGDPNDEGVSVPTWAAPHQAVGKPAGARPAAPAPQRQQPRRPLSKTQSEQLTAAIVGLVGDELDNVDPQTRAKINSRATQLATDPASEYHQDPAGAAEAAIREIAPDGFEKRGTYGSRKLHPKGSAVAPAGGAGGEQRKTINGKNYVKRNGQWFEE